MQTGAKSFEDLHIFQEARELTRAVYAATRTAPLSRDYALVDQLRRSAISVLSNIAEGFERGSRPEFVRFLLIAKGSCGECRAQLIAASDQEYISLQTFEDLTVRCRRLSAGLSNLIRYLRSRIKK